jgi:hypothetical protein
VRSDWYLTLSLCPFFASSCGNLLSLLITSTLAIRLLVLSQLGKKQRLSLKWPLTVEIVVYIRETVPSELDRK